jgi:hypothetical protein
MILSRPSDASGVVSTARIAIESAQPLKCARSHSDLQYDLKAGR